jgi:hypothetical protein
MSLIKHTLINIALVLALMLIPFSQAQQSSDIQNLIAELYTQDKMCIHRAMFSLLTIVSVCLLILTTSLTAQQQQIKEPGSRTQVVLLGTGTPPADPDRSGPATAIVVNGTPYLVDFGVPEVRLPGKRA